MIERVAALGLVIVLMSAALMGGDPTYATRGMVKSASAAEIVVARARNRGDITIALSRGTHVDGTIKVGVTVSVRYHNDHKKHLATAVVVERQVKRN